jgi:hypothetical protein
MTKAVEIRRFLPALKRKLFTETRPDLVDDTAVLFILKNTTPIPKNSAEFVS